jgi:hypothetical protein
MKQLFTILIQDLAIQTTLFTTAVLFMDIETIAKVAFALVNVAYVSIKVYKELKGIRSNNSDNSDNQKSNI